MDLYVAVLSVSGSHGTALHVTDVIDKSLCRMESQVMTVCLRLWTTINACLLQLFAAWNKRARGGKGGIGLGAGRSLRE